MAGHAPIVVSVLFDVVSTTLIFAGFYVLITKVGRKRVNWTRFGTGLVVMVIWWLGTDLGLIHLNPLVHSVVGGALALAIGRFSQDDDDDDHRRRRREQQAKRARTDPKAYGALPGPSAS